MWKAFHHPDISLPVVRRALAEQLCELVMEYANFSRSPLQWYLSPEGFGSLSAYHSAVYRLRKMGLLVTPGRGGRPTRLAVTAKARQGETLRLDPEKHWRHKWNGIWYMLVYDVPEKDKRYRESLRLFLRRMRLGCLQRSVWVSARDIRPQYDDLVKAAGVQAYALLFESRTVLGQAAEVVVRKAWDWGRLNQIQRFYCEVYGANLLRLRAEPIGDSELNSLLREEFAAYQAAFAEDPLLPRSLWPAQYLGPQVLGLHRELLREISQR